MIYNFNNFDQGLFYILFSYGKKLFKILSSVTFFKIIKLVPFFSLDNYWKLYFIIIFIWNPFFLY